MRTILKNGLLIDGTGEKRFHGSVAIEGERIVAIGDIPEQDNDEVLDVSGLVVAPGFIDTHSHSDLKVLVDPYIEPKIRQGVTTEVLGQDGISMAPLPEQYISPWRKNLAGLDGDSDDIDWHYKTTDGYLKLMERQGVGLNQSYLVPHGNIRMEVLGLGNHQPTAAEIKKMCDVTRREMEAGAFGLSTGLIYMPCAYSETPEIIELCKVVAEFDGVFVVHQRSEADTILPSMAEVIEVGRRSGVKIHFSHFKVCGRKNWRFIEPMLELLDQATAEGIRISYDQYPYVAGSTMLGVILPPWAHDGGTDRLLKRLQDPEQREKMIYDMEHGIPGWDNFVAFAGLDQIFVTSVKTAKNQELVGKSLVEIGQLRGKDPYQATFDLLYEEENAVGMVDFYGKEEHVITFLTRPEQNVCTDGLLAGKPHPRVYGSFPRVLGRYVRELKALTLEEAIFKMTSRPAEVFGFAERGALKTGYYADIVVFNPDTIIDKGTFVDPIQYPEGIEHVFINGQAVIQQGVYHTLLAGKVLRKRVK
ncbi:N-acyl-D-amino-acid deacylase family protein [Desulforamulus aeronauticus]|uniref:N-acyl-D-amino-acid deacylase n=1 Tax=Desulforamulus aeronauticus DSM 10349 TaxID=1121421 RepID=A0A1M6P086_9FIRM|nr:D-aminoacylase [Desulforamulus aeronauticus]SHK01397.1 N-acyl-D-amino-acid deacylase [Desulforamulus aeronauticus DSM 10349]